MSLWSQLLLYQLQTCWSRRSTEEWLWPEEKQTAGSHLKASTGRGSGSLRMKRRSRGKDDILKELSLFNLLLSLTHFLMSCEQSADGCEHLLVRAGVSDDWNVHKCPHAPRTWLWAQWRCWSLHKSVLSDGLMESSFIHSIFKYFNLSGSFSSLFSVTLPLF